MFKRILVPTDGSDGALLAGHLASKIAAPRGQVVLLHVVPGIAGTALAALDAVGLVMGEPAGGLSAEWLQTATRHGSERLARFRQALGFATVPTVDLATELEVGRPANVILDRLEHGSFDAVVMGGRGHGLLKHVLLGSVATEVLMHSTKPVMIARGETIRRVLIATDGSESSLRAAAAAGELARELDVVIEMISAIELPTEVATPQRDAIKKAVGEHAKGAFENARKAVPVTIRNERVVFQEPVQAILNEAASSGTDLIVAGRLRDPGRVNRIGSVAYRLAMSAHCSVLIVP